MSHTLDLMYAPVVVDCTRFGGVPKPYPGIFACLCGQTLERKEKRQTSWQSGTGWTHLYHTISHQCLLKIASDNWGDFSRFPRMSLDSTNIGCEGLWGGHCVFLKRFVLQLKWNSCNLRHECRYTGLDWVDRTTAIYAYVYIHVHACMHEHIFIHTRTFVRTYVVRKYMHKYRQILEYVWICLYMIMYIHTYPYIDIDAGAKVLLYNFIFESVRAAGPQQVLHAPLPVMAQESSRRDGGGRVRGWLCRWEFPGVPCIEQFWRNSLGAVTLKACSLQNLFILYMNICIYEKAHT